MPQKQILQNRIETVPYLSNLKLEFNSSSWKFETWISVQFSIFNFQI